MKSLIALRRLMRSACADRQDVVACAVATLATAVELRRSACYLRQAISCYDLSPHVEERKNCWRSSCDDMSAPVLCSLQIVVSRGGGSCWGGSLSSPCLTACCITGIC